MAYLPSRYEQETIILFNEEQKTATIETYNMKMKNKLLQMAKDKPDQVTIKLDDGQRVKAIIPKKWIRVNSPKIMSEEQRKIASERMANIRNKQLGRTKP